MSTTPYENDLTISAYKPHPWLIGAAFAIIVIVATAGLVRGFLMTDRTPRSVTSSETGVAATQAAPSDQRLSPGDFLMAEPVVEEETEVVEPVKAAPIAKTEVAPPPIVMAPPPVVETPAAAPPPAAAPVTAEVLY